METLRSRLEDFDNVKSEVCGNPNVAGHGLARKLSTLSLFGNWSDFRC